VWRYCSFPVKKPQRTDAATSELNPRNEGDLHQQKAKAVSQKTKSGAL